MNRVINIIIYIACALAWIALVWFIVSFIEVNLHNLDSCSYSDWNLLKLIFGRYL